MAGRGPAAEEDAAVGKLKEKETWYPAAPRVRAMITKLSALNFDRDVEGTNQVSKLKTWSSQVLKQIKMKAPQGG